MSPWIETERSLAGNRWLDESGVALRGMSAGQTTVSGDLERGQGWVGTCSGQASVSGELTVAHILAGSSAGASSASGLLGWLYPVEGLSLGTAQVSGALQVGIAQEVEGASAGRATVSGTLSVRRYTHISGQQDDDNWGSDQDRPPMGAGRDEGPTRRRFTPHSSGRVNV